MNFWIYFALGIVAVVLQSTLFVYPPLHYFQPDILLIIVVYMGFRRNIIEGGFFAACAGVMVEANSGSASQFMVLTYMYAFLIAKILSRILVAPDFLSSLGMSGALFVIKKIGILLLLATRGHFENGVRHFFIFLFPGVFVQLLLTPILFAWFMKIDLLTYKDDHAEDEYDINKGL